LLVFEQELTAVEQSFADVCNQISKAERFFPVPGIASGDQGSAKPYPAEGMLSPAPLALPWPQ
jgi:hypothetical protein